MPRGIYVVNKMLSNVLSRVVSMIGNVIGYLESIQTSINAVAIDIAQLQDDIGALEKRVGDLTTN